jgi:galactoside O-acetyltransferase
VNGFLSRAEIEAFGFARVGADVQIDRTARIYGAERLEIGDHVRIDAYSVISCGADGISIGNHVHVAAFAFLAGAARIELRDFANLSGRVSIYSSNDDYSGNALMGPTVPDELRNVTNAPVVLGRHAIVGAGSVVLPGVEIGDGAAVGALTLVRRDVEPFTTVVGTDGRVLGERSTRVLELERRVSSLHEQLADPRRGFASDLSADSSTLVVFFGGLRPGEEVPQYDWLNVSRAVHAKRLYLRDLDQAWYHLGIRGLGSSIAEAARALDALIRDIGPSRIVFVGSSFGGYGAILFGWLLGVDAVHTCCPQAFVSQAERERHGEGRWGDEMAGLHASGGGVDLRPFLTGLGVPPVPTAVHYAVDEPLDVIHARELGELPGVELHSHPEGGHFLPRLLADRGELVSWLGEAGLKAA